MTNPETGNKKLETGDVIWILRRILGENLRDHLGSYAIAIACLVSVALSTAYLAWIMRDVVNEIFYKNRADLIYLLAGSVFLAFIVRGIATYGQGVQLAKIGNNIVARYQARIFNQLMALGMDFYADKRSGQLAAMINQNVNGVRNILNITLTSLARDAVALIGLVAVMFVQDPVLSSAALLIGPPLGLAINYLMKRIRTIARQSLEINAKLMGAMQEATQGITIVKAFTMEKQLDARMDEMIAWAENRANKISRVSERSTPIAEILAGIIVSLAIAYTGYRALHEGQLPGSMVAFVTAMMLAYDPARRLARVQVGLQPSLVNARMIFELLDIEPQQRDKPDARPLSIRDGEIRFENVSFGYARDLPVLHNVSLTAAAGTTTAIVGGSGAGKSTMIALLQRFYDPDSGRILIDGQDISGATKDSLRNAIAYVSQQPYLFEGTIRDNIRYGRAGATDAEIEEAARLAHAEEFIAAQPLGYDTPVGENGVTLSGGQRQRLSIARAIVRKAPILLLDEATSALDNESEKRVQQALEAVMKGRTTIVIAHRLSTVIHADTIVVMDNGRIAEQGTHETLLAKADGLYRRFHDLQHQKAADLQLSGGTNGEMKGTEQ